MGLFPGHKFAITCDKRRSHCSIRTRPGNHSSRCEGREPAHHQTGRCQTPRLRFGASPRSGRFRIFTVHDISATIASGLPITFPPSNRSMRRPLRRSRTSTVSAAPCSIFWQGVCHLWNRVGVEKIRAHRQEKAPFGEITSPPTFPIELRPSWRKLLKKNPDNRFESMNELIQSADADSGVSNRSTSA